MDNKIGLENILRAELTLLSKQILQDVHQKDFKELFRAVKKLHEKMAAIKVLSEQLTDTDIIKVFYPESVEKEVLTEKISPSRQSIAEHRLVEDTIVESSKKVEESQVNQVSTNDNMVSINKDIANISFVKKEKQETVIPPEKKVEEPIQNIKESEFEITSHSKKSNKEMSIGLNDRIAFINNLFVGNSEAFNETINKLNACHSYENALTVIYKEIKPKYNNWEGKDQYEFRFLQLLELKFN